MILIDREELVMWRLILTAQYILSAMNYGAETNIGFLRH